MKPKKSLGQNFLINSDILPIIINAADIDSSDTIIEVGPGTGILTDALIKTGAQVFAVEKDFELIEILRKNIKNNNNLKIVHQDALLFDLSQFNKYKVVANIPYNITSPLIRKFLESENQPELMVLMVQKEVAERITAKPGDSNRGILTIAVEFYTTAEIITEVSKTSFRPMPKVDSAVIKIQPKKHHPGGGRMLVKPDIFFKIVKAGFSSKRQQIHNSLAATLRLDKNLVLDILEKAKIDPTLRAEDLNLNDWVNLYLSVGKKV